MRELTTKSSTYLLNGLQRNYKIKLDKSALTETIFDFKKLFEFSEELSAFPACWYYSSDDP